MENPPQHGLGIALTDDDLKALGGIVASWAVAETTMRHVLMQFHTHPAVAATGLPTENIWQFKRKRENWKKSIKLMCADHHEYRDIGRFLSIRGKVLQKLRDQACHWPGSRAIKNPDGKVHFSDPTNLTGGEKVAFDTRSLMQAAHDIHEWGGMLGMYAVMVTFDLLRPSPGTVSGERPAWMLEVLRNYHGRFPLRPIPTSP